MDRASGGRRRLGRSRRAARARFTNSATLSGSLVRSLVRRRAAAPRPDATSTPIAGRRADGLADGRRSQAAGEDDRDLSGDRGGERRGGAGAGPARVRTAGGVEQQPRGAGREVLATEGDDRSGGGRRRSRARRRAGGGPSRPAARSSRRSAPAARSPDSWTASGSRARDDLCRSAPRRRSAVIATICGRRPGGGERPGDPPQLDRLVSVRRTRRPRDEIRARSRRRRRGPRRGRPRRR